MYYLEVGYGKHNRLRNALLLAIALHVLVIVVITFEPVDTDTYARQIEVTLATRPDSVAPESAERIAQENQRGIGEDAESEPLPFSTETAPGQGLSAPPAAMRPDDSRGDPNRDPVATAAAARRVVKADQQEHSEDAVPLLGISPEVDRLTRELSDLEAALDEQARDYADMPRVRRLTSVSARRSVDAAYLDDWRRRVEAVGNKFYPEASRRYGIFGKVRLLVVIGQDGNLEDIKVLSSSGYAVLDEAAIKIVRMAAPYAPFPDELKATTDQLEIIRTWHYEENRLSSD